MKIKLICSRDFYTDLKDVKTKLETFGHEVMFPDDYNEFLKSKAKAPVVVPVKKTAAPAKTKVLTEDEKADLKKKGYKKQSKNIGSVDAVLCLNLEKRGKANHIGGASFLGLYEAFLAGKKIFLWNYIPEDILHDEIVSFNPVVIKRMLKNVK